MAILGDFNALPDASEVKLLRSRYADAYEAAGGVSPGHTYRADHPDRRVDYIFVGTGVRPLEAHVVEGELASDHLPLVVRVQIGP